MRWPWQKRRDRPEPVLAAPGAGREASAPAPAAAPQPGPRRESATLPPLQPLAPRRPVTTVDVELAKVSAVPTTLVHRFEPRAHAGEAPTGVWLDAAHLAGDVEARQPEPARAASATDAAMELPPLVMRWAPAVEPDPVIEPPVAEPAASSPPPAAPAPADEPVTAPPRVTREPSGSTATAEPDDSQPDATDAGEAVEPPPRPLRRNLGQTRRLGLGPPIVREPEPEPEPTATDPVPDDIRRELHSAYGVDVGDVTIRRDDAAASEARDLGAIAFARDGREVVLPADVGSIDRPDVKGVVAHELTHIAQQRRGGPSLPDETSTEGMALEAEARAAEQRFRGNAGAPPLTRPGTGGHAQLLTTGLAETNDAGDVVFVPPPRAAAGVQRLVLEATTPPYQWQRDYVGPEGAATPLEPPPPEGGEGEFPPSIDDATFERENLPELVQYRQTQRQQYVEDELVSTGFTGPPPPAPAAAPLTEDQQRALDERTAIEAELQRRTQVVDVHNRAVDEVNVALPLQDTAADPGAEPSPADIEPEVVRLRGELARIDASYPDLVHPALEIGERGPAFRPRDLIREVIPGVRSMPVIGPALAGVPGGLTTGTTGLTATGLAGTGLTPGIGIAPGTLTPSTPTGRSLIGEVGTTSVRDSSSYSIDRGEESDFTDWLDEGDTDLATLVEEDAREREYQRWPEIRTARNQLLRYFIVEKATEIRNEAQAAGTDVPSESQATSRITRDEWQAIAVAVEQMVPLEYTENEQYSLFDDPENDHLREVVALAPMSRDVPSGPSSLEAPRGAVGPAVVSGAPMTFTPTAGPTFSAPTAERPVFAATAADAGSATTPQQFALATGALDEAEVAAETGEAEGGATATGGAESEFRLDDPEIEISTELLIRLTTELYPRLRSRLRTELLVDRERAGLLTDFR